MKDEKMRLRMAILSGLAETGRAAGAAAIAHRLEATGLHLKPRTVRLHLLQMDREGLTRTVSRRRGREITARGREELAKSNVIRKVGFVSSRIDNLGHDMTYSLARGGGTLIANVSLIRRSLLLRAIEDMRPVFARGFSTGSHLAIVKEEDEKPCGIALAPGMAALVTVCAFSLNAILMREGIPIQARYGGLVEIVEGRPERFVELADYRGVTSDPVDLFIRAGMTSARAAARSGNGLVGASFREIPAAAVAETRRLRARLRQVGLDGVVAIGDPGATLLGVPVSEGRAGMVVYAGLNPLAAIREAGTPIEIGSMCGLVDLGALSLFADLRRRFPA